MGRPARLRRKLRRAEHFATLAADVAALAGNSKSGARLAPAQRGRTGVPAPKYRHLMTYYDNRFAQEDMGLLFCLANTRIRHEVNQAASAKVHSSGRAWGF